MFDTDMSLDDARSFLREIEDLKRHQGATYTADAIKTVLFKLEDAQHKLIGAQMKLKELQRQQAAIKEIMSKDCNNCMKRKSCPYIPELGKQTRINCYMWEEVK